MAKDPAFLYYDGDAARDVSHMNRLERGCYFDLIQAQRKFGGYSVEQARKILGKDFDECWPALELVLSKDDKSIFYIDWVRDSTNKRKENADIQRERIQDYWDKKKGKGKYHGITKEVPLENAIVINSIPISNYTEAQKIKNNEQMIVLEMMKVWKKHNPKYPEDANEDYPACLEMAYKIATVKGWKKADVIDFMELQCLESWDKIVAFIKTDPFLKNLALKNLSNQFQMIFQKMQNKNEEMSLNGHAAKVVKKTRAQIEKEMEEWANS